jgi:hypothetical protein
MLFLWALQEVKISWYVWKEYDKYTMLNVHKCMKAWSMSMSMIMYKEIKEPKLPP